MPSQYSAENVSLSGGGRAALTRAAASLGSMNLGHFLPDYTAYEELLDVFKAFTAIPILLEGERGYAFTHEDLRREVQGRGLSALLFSNPCNPTGKLVQGDELARWVGVAREQECSLLIDEFYSHYVWTGRPGQLPVESATRYVEDVNKDPVVVFDGLTKNWRYPGWRMTWTVGPKQVIEAVSSAGSFLDGGGSRPLQRAALPLLEEQHVVAETQAINAAFREKRDRFHSRLERLGIRSDRPPDGTFYVWGNLAGPAAAAQRRHGLLPGRAGAEDHLRARRVLRREPGQAARPLLALPAVRAPVLRPVHGGAGQGARAAGGHGAAPHAVARAAVTPLPLPHHRSRPRHGPPALLPLA